MNKGEKTFKIVLLLIAATVCGFTVGALVGGVAGLIISLVMQPRVDFVFSSVALFSGAGAGWMLGSPIGLLVGFIYSFPRARRYHLLIASSGAIVGFVFGQFLIADTFFNCNMAVWIPVIISVFSGAACALLVAAVLQRVTAESGN
jgi:hypothetical protein